VKGLKLLLINCTLLHNLNMSRTRGITETRFEEVVPYFKSLKYLNMGSSSAVSDQTISALAVYCTQLKCLKLFGCRQLTDVAIITLARNCTKLLELDLSSCRITDLCINEIALRCKELISLQIAGCIQITSESLIHIIQQCIYLKCLMFNNNSELVSFAKIIRVEYPDIQLNYFLM